MKAITIWQPWASLLACGAKRFETRSWATSYRGPIAIHAAKKDVFEALKMIPIPIAVRMKEIIQAEWRDLPTGAVIATARLVDCYETDLRNAPDKAGYWACRSTRTWVDVSRQEAAFGDWTPGRYAWDFADVKIITPVPVSGRQGLWEWRRP